MHNPFLDDLNKRFPRRQPEPPYRPAPFIYKHPIITFFLFIVGALLLAGILVASCSGQTISPAISEAHGNRVHGEFTVTNNQIIPMAVWIEPQTVIGSGAGQIFFQHLASNVQVKLTSTSARLSPKQSYSIGYEILCQTLPCVVNFNAAFSGLRSSGLAVTLRINNIVYVCARQKNCRDEIRKGWNLK